MFEKLNSEYPKEIIYNNKFERIYYSWKKTIFDKLKEQIKNDFELIF